MKQADLTGMDRLDSWDNLDLDFESIDRILQRLKKLRHGRQLLIDILPCFADRERYIIDMLVADGLAAAAARIKAQALKYLAERQHDQEDVSMVPGESDDSAF